MDYKENILAPQERAVALSFYNFYLFFR